MNEGEFMKKLLSRIVAMSVALVIAFGSSHRHLQVIALHLRLRAALSNLM